MDTPSDLTSGDDQFATLREARSAIENLQDTDYKDLMIFARRFAKNKLKGTVIEPDDLFQQAILKTLDGRRRWNRRVSIIEHLDGVMKSDSGHEVDKRAVRGFSQLPEHNVEPIDQQPSPEVLLLIRDELKDLLDLFDGDEIALKLLHLKRDGFSASEIQLELGIEKRHYETVNKRIRRRVLKYLAEGST